MQRLLYILIYPLLWVLSILPLSILFLLSDIFYVVAYYIIGYRKNVVKANLNLVFPHKPEKEINQITKDFYKHLCDLIVENIKSITISEKELASRFKPTNIELLDHYYQQDRSIIMVTGHYGNWEWSSIMNKLTDYEIFAVYKPLANTYFDKLVKDIRGRFGAEPVSNRYIVPKLYRKKKQGKKTIAYILSDQSPKLNAYKHSLKFMDIKVPVFTGPEEIAKKLDLSVLYLKIKKVKRGRYEATFVPLVDDPSEFPDFEITRLFFDEIEKQIEESPAQYLWSHKRWKHRDKI